MHSTPHEPRHGAIARTPSASRLRRNVPRGWAVAIVLVCACGGTRTDVYVAGYVNYGPGETATLWTYGNPVALTAEPQRSLATAVTVSDTGDVYVAGSVARAAGSTNMAVYWKNGAPVALTDGTRESSAEAITVSGGHVYVAGYETDAWPVTVARLWKDGVATPLTTGASKAVASSIAVSGDDVYVAGYETETTEVAPQQFMVVPVAKVWKNGVATTLTDGTNVGVANSVALFGGDVYVAGWEGPPGPGLAKVWKNGVLVALTDDVLGAQANAVTLRGSDVLAVGGQFNGRQNVPKIWTNGVAVNLAADGTALAKAIAVAGTDVFVVGYDGDAAVYWKNGTAYRLSHPISHAVAMSIAIYEH